MVVERVGSETLLSRIVKLVSEAQRRPRADAATGGQSGRIFRAWGRRLLQFWRFSAGNSSFLARSHDSLNALKFAWAGYSVLD